MTIIRQLAEQNSAYCLPRPDCEEKIMMKKSELIFSAILVPLDFLMLLSAALSAYFLRFSALTDIRPVILEWPFQNYLKISLVVAFVWLIIFALAGLYSIGGLRRLIDELTRVFLACSTGIMAVIIFVFFKRELLTSRFIVLAVWGLSIITVNLGRLLMRGIQHLLFKKGVGVHRVVIIGNENTTDNLVAEMHRSPALGYKVVGRFVDFDQSVKQQIEEIAERKGIDEILLSNPALPREKILELLDFANAKHWVFKYAVDLLEAQSTNLEVNMLAGIPIVEIKKTPLDGWGKIVKRVFDFVGALLLIILFSPLMLLIVLAIKLESRGPIIYKNERVGQKNFKIFKFRSMYLKYCTGNEYGGEHALQYEEKLINEKSERQGPVYKVLADPRRTKVGCWLEKTSLDELPQFFNVLFGQMSLVGPRPHQPREVEQYQKHQKRVLDIKPGVTGLAQISGRSDLDFEEEVKLDTYYIENWSLKLDLQILFKTPWAVLTRGRRV